MLWLGDTFNGNFMDVLEKSMYAFAFGWEWEVVTFIYEKSFPRRSLFDTLCIAKVTFYLSQSN